MTNAASSPAPDPEFPEEKFATSVASRFVDSRYFAQRDGESTLNAWMTQVFDRLHAREWDPLWDLLQTEPARLCRSTPLASPFNAVIGNRINLVFAELYTLANLVNRNLADEAKPSYVPELLRALDFANKLDYRAYVRWGVVARSRYENVQDVAGLLISQVDDVLKFLIDDYSIIRRGASDLKELIEQVLAMEELKDED